MLLIFLSHNVLWEELTNSVSRIPIPAIIFFSTSLTLLFQNQSLILEKKGQCADNPKLKELISRLLKTKFWFRNTEAFMVKSRGKKNRIELKGGRRAGKHCSIRLQKNRKKLKNAPFQLPGNIRKSRKQRYKPDLTGSFLPDLYYVQCSWSCAEWTDSGTFTAGTPIEI